jgi:hypothetical protein
MTITVATKCSLPHPGPRWLPPPPHASTAAVAVSPVRHLPTAPPLTPPPPETMSASPVPPSPAASPRWRCCISVINSDATRREESHFWLSSLLRCKLPPLYCWSSFSGGTVPHGRYFCVCLLLLESS